MIVLKKLSHSDGEDIYKMLKGIELIENSFSNPTYNLTFEEFKDWLIQQENWSDGKNLPQGFVKQTIYWLYDDDIPVGMGKIRHELTDESRRIGGNIGYAVSKKYRGKRYGVRMLELLLDEAKRLGVSEVLLTVDKGNIPSINVCKRNGGIVVDENEERIYFSF